MMVTGRLIDMNPEGRWPKVAIIVLNWNGWRDTIECLESLYQIIYPDYEIIVVDNGSEDGSIEKIIDYCNGKLRIKSKFFEYDQSNKPINIIECPIHEDENKDDKKIEYLKLNKTLILIRNEKNYGFAEGNNIGIKYALKFLNPSYILLLNNDTIVHKDFLRKLVKCAESDNKIGIIAPKIYYYEHPNKIWFAGGEFCWWKGYICHAGQGEEDQLEKREIIITDQISGCAMLIKSNVITRIGKLDNIYPLNYEDADFCIRAKRLGFNLVVLPSSLIWHKCGISKKKVKNTALYFITLSSLLFYKKWGKKYLPFLVFKYFIIALYYLSIRDFNKLQAIFAALVNFARMILTLRPYACNEASGASIITRVIK